MSPCPLLLAALGERRGTALFSTVLFFFLFGLAAKILNHLATSAAAPLVDTALARMDAALGLGEGVYLALVSFLNDHETVRLILQRAYSSHELAFMFVILFLSISGRIERLREFTLVFAMTALATLLIGGLFPAAGAFHHYQPPAEIISGLPPEAGRYCLPYILPLRAGTMTAIDMTAMPGLVSMPSYHTVMALMVASALRRTWAFAPAALYCALTIAATPVFGGHYFVDLIAGTGLFFASLAVLGRARGAIAAQTARLNAGQAA